MTRTHRKTVDLCYFKEDDGCPCAEEVSWKLRTMATQDTFKVCDTHLAWGMRLSGAPALVEEFVPVKTCETD